MRNRNSSSQLQRKTLRQSRIVCTVVSGVYSPLGAGRGHQCDSVQRLPLAPHVSENGLPSPGIALPAIGAGLV